MLRLTTTHDHNVRQADLPAEATELGASPDCGIHVPFPGVSRKHARVEPVAGGIKVIDLGSKNGLRQKGRRLNEVTLLPGQSVHLGRARLTLEEVDTSDTILGGAHRMRPLTSDAKDEGGRDSDTDTVATDGLDSTPGEALRLLREVEESGVDLAGPHGNELLDRATRILGAISLFTFTPSVGGPALRHLNGAVPSDAQIQIAVALALGSSDEEVVSGLSADGMTVLVNRLGVRREDPVLVALLGLGVSMTEGKQIPVDAGSVRPQGLRPLPQPRLKPWRRDLFAYIAHRLRPAAARKTPAAKTGTSVALVLPEGFVRGRSEAMTRLLGQLHAAARSDLDVLILGETGVGKEYVARIIHHSGPTAAGPFVAINCAAIPSELLEAELFGVKARVATGVDARTGLLTRAQGGCVFLDEIGDMPGALQAKLLRALQEREVMPIGGHHPEPIQVRVLSSTNKDLTALVRSNHFRPDLYYRLRGLEFVLPPLRDRREDVALLALAFADRAALSHKKDIAGISRRALDLLEAHDWPGNVRELRSEIERAVLLCPDGGTLSSGYFESLRRAVRPGAIDAAGFGDHSITPASAPPVSSAPPQKHAAASLASQVDEVETRAIKEALDATHGNRTAAAKRLGITRNGLAMMMKRLGITNEA